MYPSRCDFIKNAVFSDISNFYSAFIAWFCFFYHRPVLQHSQQYHCHVVHDQLTLLGPMEFFIKLQLNQEAPSRILRGHKL